ncbi:MAG: NAD(P)-dependent glycerol-3-phosphate dehydrogenase [Synergistaceae bacterium]|nr:NAD(P)-dependent glycerol-3-phosphate dehydrogenase [Synergistaceae bacterium]
MGADDRGAFAVIGAGSFGTAVADLLARAGARTVLWCRDPAQARAIDETHHNPRRLRERELAPSLRATSDLGEALAEAGHVIVAVPTQSLRDVLGRLREHGAAGASLLSLAKGVEISTGLLPEKIFEDVMGQGASFAALSGPSHAEEVVRGLPTAVIVAARDRDVALGWQARLGGPRFRVYTSGDVLGVELGGAVKNVIAIAVGVADALSLGDNARAALAARGLAEIMRLGAAMGASPLTLAGLAGAGDLMATCYSPHSRNLRFGMAIGRGASPEDAAAEIGEVVEGAHTVRALVAWAQRWGVELPICAGVHAVLYEGASLHETIERLLFRAPKEEGAWPHPPSLHH